MWLVLLTLSGASHLLFLAPIIGWLEVSQTEIVWLVLKRTMNSQVLDSIWLSIFEVYLALCMNLHYLRQARGSLPILTHRSPTDIVWLLTHIVILPFRCFWNIMRVWGRSPENLDWCMVLILFKKLLLLGLSNLRELMIFLNHHWRLLLWSVRGLSNSRLGSAIPLGVMRGRFGLTCLRVESLRGAVVTGLGLNVAVSFA